MSATQIRSSIETLCRRLGLRVQTESVYQEIWKLRISDIPGFPELSLSMPEDHEFQISFDGLKGTISVLEEEDHEVSFEHEVVSILVGFAKGTIRLHYSEGMFGTTLRLAEKTADGWEMGRTTWTMRFHPWPTFRPTIFQAPEKL